MTNEAPIGRPRDRGVDHAIVQATRELLVESGYTTLTVDAVSQRAGVGKAAIYRRYATKQEMVFSAAVHDLELSAPPDTGSLLGDLTGCCKDIVATLTGPAVFAGIPGLFADVATDETLAERFQQTFIARERAILEDILRRAVERGEIARKPTTAVVHSLLLGPIFAWLFMFRGDKRRIATTVATHAHASITTLGQARARRARQK